MIDMKVEETFVLAMVGEAGVGVHGLFNRISKNNSNKHLTLGESTSRILDLNGKGVKFVILPYKLKSI